MAYPNKIDPSRVVDTALLIVERDGHEALSPRRLAGEIGVTANALYRHFSSRDVLVAATADAVARRLFLAVEDGVAKLPSDAIAAVRVKRLLVVYAAFADRNASLYRMLLSAKPEVGALLPQPRYHERLWQQSLAIIEPLSGGSDAPAATVTPMGIIAWHV